MRLISSHRMYDVNPRVAALWADFYALISARSGVALEPLDYPAPAPLGALWARQDMGLVQICGWPFHRAAPQPAALAAPVLADARGGGAPLYWSDMIVRADAPFRTLEDTFGGRIAWTAAESHSGFNAPRRLLLDAFRARGAPLYAQSVGPLVSPRRVIEAVLEGEADIGPLDAHFHLLLQRHEPETAARLRVAARTPLAPAPLLAASAGVPEASAGALRAALLEAHRDEAGAALLRALCIERYAAADPPAYALGENWHREALAAGYAQPG